jgi:hypothetical protein
MPKGIFKNPEARAAKVAEKLRRGAFFPCTICGKQFWRKPCAIKKGDNKFCSKSCYFTWQKGRKRSAEFCEKCRQTPPHKRPNWKGGITPINLKIRSSWEFRKWKASVYERDHWTCRKCGAKKSDHIKIEAHHVKPFATFPELRFLIDNGLTLCKKCHSNEPKGKEIYAIT